MNNLEMLKLDRALWSAYIDREDLEKAIQCYEEYINNLKNYKEDIVSVNNEINLCEQLFQIKMNILSDKYIKEKNYRKALIATSAAFKNNSLDTKCVKNYIICLNELKQGDLELSLMQHLEEISDSNKSEIYKIKSQVAEKKKSYLEAVEYMNKYMESKGSQNQNADDYNQIGILYDKYYTEITHKRADEEKSLNYFIKASDMAPNANLYAENVTVTAHKINEFETARKYWDRLFKINNMSDDDKYYYSMFCLRTEDFEGWYKYFDYRFTKKYNPTLMPKFNKPKWNGTEDLSNATLLVYYEQGYGDTFLTWGYIPRLIKMAKKVIFVVQEATYELFKNNEYGVEVHSGWYVDLDKLDFDYYIPSMSIPIVLKLNRNNISVGEGYLKPSESLILDYKQKYFNNNKFKIGISFLGHKNGDHTRDIDIKEFLPLDELDNIEIYNLTKEADDNQFEIFKKNKVINVVKDAENFAYTAAAIANCDAVLTSDNCILNLAGAIGIKTFALFNWTNQLRWFELQGENVVWYSSVKPFVCNDIDNWQSAIIPAINDIKKLTEI